MSLGNQCVILVGGKGTRLGALTRNRPKPLLPVGGKPFLSYLVHESARHGFSNILLLAGFKADIVADELATLQEQTPVPVTIKVIAEPASLGTGGALRYASDHLDDQFLMMNGDSFFDINLCDLTARPLTEGAMGRLALKSQPDVSRYGTVELDGEHIRSFVEKRTSGGPGLINGGVYWFRREMLAYIPNGAISLEQAVLPDLARKGQLLGSIYDRYLLDIGLPDTLARAQHEVPARMRRPAVFLREGLLSRSGGNAQAVKAWNDAGYYVFAVCPNAAESATALHRAIAADMASCGAHIDAFAFCPYRAAGTLPDVLSAWSADKQRSLMIGDAAGDLQIAAAAGLSGHLSENGDLTPFAPNPR